MGRGLCFATLLMIAQVSTPKCGETTPSAPGGSSSSTTPPAASSNVLSIAVNGGPTNDSLNQPFASVTICMPGTSNCQTIGGILIDTGSIGLRILASAVTVPLPAQNNASGAPLGECLAFVDGSVIWGPVRTADVRMAGEQASSAPIQLIGGDGFGTVPSGCSSQGTPQQNVTDLNTNGILGVGMFRQDCGLGCTLTGSSNPGLYYACPTPATCQVATVPVASQVVNPVSLFPIDNNGIALQLPAAQSGGQASMTGSLIFGIGTQSNNGLGSAKVFTVDSRANFTTTFNGQSYNKTFMDSGSNAVFFLDAATTGLPECVGSKGFYCPTSPRAFSATQIGANGTSSVVPFNAGNVDRVNATFSVFGEATGSQSGTFDWGLPFFFGRTVFVAIQGASTPGGAGPYWAY
jgi:hypothetical protein